MQRERSRAKSRADLPIQGISPDQVGNKKDDRKNGARPGPETAGLPQNRRKSGSVRFGARHARHESRKSPGESDVNSGCETSRSGDPTVLRATGPKRKRYRLSPG